MFYIFLEKELYQKFREMMELSLKLIFENSWYYSIRAMFYFLLVVDGLLIQQLHPRRKEELGILLYN